MVGAPPKVGGREGGAPEAESGCPRRKKDKTTRGSVGFCLSVREKEPAHAALLLLLSRLDWTSPSASQRHALTSWMTLMNCFMNMTGKLTPAMTQGQKLSILLARAISRAPAL